MAEYIFNAILIFLLAHIARRIPCLRNKRGSLVIGDLLSNNKDIPVKKHRQRIGNAVFPIKSVFIGQRELDAAMKNIMLRKMETDRSSVSE